MGKRLLATTAVCNYRPEICALTFPNLRRYAERCGADFAVITDRKYPEWHPAYEKLQVHDLAKNYDFTLLIDADMALHPRFPDLYESMRPGACSSWMEYKISGGPESLILWSVEGDRYFLRDGRNLGLCGAFVGCTSWTYDVFKPLDSHFRPSDVEPFLYRPAIVDEWVMSRNVAKYGLKVDSLWPSKEGIYHADVTTKGETEEEIIKKLRAQLEAWGK